MENIFLELLNRSIKAGWLVLAIILLRYMLKKAPKSLFVVLWALVAIRLICPFAPESVFSLLPSTDPIPTNIMYSGSTTPSHESNIKNEIDLTVTPDNGQHAAEATEVGSAEKNSAKLLNVLSTAVWVSGMFGLLLYAAISSLRLRRKIRESIPLRENIRLCDRIDTPFLLGLIRPSIYLPSSLAAEDAEYAIAHERAHIKRHDHWWKPLGFLLLTVYWFNPLMWIAYALLCRDIELACDEKVIRKLGAESKKLYSIALINCSVSRRAIAMCPLAFGEVAVKERVKTVLRYKKPTFWLSAIAVLICIAVALGFLTDPIASASVFAPTSSVSENNAMEVSAPTPPVKEIGAFVSDTDVEEVPDGYIAVIAHNELHKSPECDLEMMHAVLSKRIQTSYSSYDVDAYGKQYVSYKYDLPEEIVEKYGTRDSHELPCILIYESTGEFDSTETIELYYGKSDIDNGLYYIERTEIVTIEIPAGGVAFYVIEDDNLLSFGILCATYGDLFFTF